MTTWLPLALCQTGVIAIVALALRVQFGILRGYDLTVAASLVIASEMTILVTSQVSGWLGLPLALTVAWGVAYIVTYAWTLLMQRVKTSQAERGGVVFLASLGISTSVTGVVGIVRGPGLLVSTARLPALELGQVMVAGATWLGIVSSIVVIAGLVAWRRTATGWRVVLLEQNPVFAREIGVEREQVVTSASAAVGACAAVAGMYQGVANGSTPESGMLLLIYGIGAAFVIPGRGMIGAVGGGAIFGTASVVGGIVVSPVVASMSLFALTAVVLLIRGTSRLERGVR